MLTSHAKKVTFVRKLFKLTHDQTDRQGTVGVRVPCHDLTFNFSYHYLYGKGL